MKDVIDDIVRQKPHLADPFRFYRSTLAFLESAKELPLIDRRFPTAYPPEILDRIFELFSTVVELPEGTLAPLKHAMELREIDFTRLPLNEVPAFSLPYAEDDLAMLLSLLSKPFFVAMRESAGTEEGPWEKGRCPVCRAQPAVSWIAQNGRRGVACSYCGCTGRVNRAGCPLCFVTDAKKQNILVAGQEEWVRINTCDVCRSYIKTLEASVHERYSPDIADLASLPLDIVVQEKGYVRRSPNPIGLRRITQG